MTSFRLVAPYIRWGTSPGNYANALYLPFPLDNVVTYEDPRDGSEFEQYISGTEDAWPIGPDYVLEGDHRWIPQADTLTYPRATGWDGALGVRAALTWMRSKNFFAWHSDGRNLVRHPGLQVVADAQAGTGGGANIYNIWVGELAGSPSGASVTFDAGEPAWKVLATGATGSSDVELGQRFPVIPGEKLCLSVDYRVTGLAGGAAGNINILIYAADGTTLLQTHAVVTGLTSTTYARATTGLGGTVTPANAAYAQANLRLDLPNGASGTIWFRNATVRRETTDTTFIDNQSIDSYLVSPIKGEPPVSESDGSRKLRLKIRNYLVDYAGY